MIVSKVRSIARSFSFPAWSVPIALLLLVLLSYGLRALSLGFYWDDLPYLWYFQRLGQQGIIDAFTKDRPFLSLIYNITLSFFGTSSQAWQGFALFARWLCSMGLWWALALAWPNQVHKSTWAVFLFTIYPGFTQQWIAVIYGQAFLLYALVFFSIGITLWMARRPNLIPRWAFAGWTILALGLSGFTMFSTEYFFGLELMRPILIWIVLWQTASESSATGMRGLWRHAWKVLQWWLPYLLLMIAFIIWRGFIQIFPAATFITLEGFSQSPLRQLASLALTVVEDMVEATLVAWGQTLQLGGFLEMNSNAGLRLLAIILATGSFFSLYLSQLRPQKAGKDVSLPTQTWAWHAIVVGLLLLLSAGWPFWITGLPMRMGFPQDRYSLPLAPGVCLFLAGIIDLLGGQGNGPTGYWRKAVMVGIALGLAAGFHNNLALRYRQDWNQMRSFFWQLSWRAPEVEPGTLFLTSELPFLYYEDDSLSSPLNWTFDPGGRTKEMAYILYDLRVRRQALPSLQPDRPVEKDFRATRFSGSTSQVLVISYSPPGCVHVLDPVYDREIYDLSDRLQRALSLSDPKRLILDRTPGATPPAEVFGNEPMHRWCYYYEKAELARQMEDWEEILKIENASIHEGFRPEDPAEYLPFIEGYARLGLLDDAVQLTLSTYSESIRLRPALCAVWERAVAAGAQLNAGQSDKIARNLNCLLP